MTHRYIVASNKTDNIVGALPLKASGFGWTIQNYTNVSWTLDTKDRACPRNWKDLIESGKNYIVPVRAGAPVEEKMIGFRIGGWSETGNGTIRIESSSWERVYDWFTVQGPRFDLKDVSSEVFPAIAGVVNEDGAGCNMQFVCPPSGDLINKYISAGDRLSPREVMDDLAYEFEWTTYVVWDDAERTKFRKVTETGVPHLSTETVEPSVAFIRDANGKGNIIDYSFTDSRREGEYATFVVATGSGVDDAQIESAAIIDHEQEIDHDRIPKIENFPGVDTVEEANIAAQRMADNLFKKRNIITLKVASDGAVKPWQVERGMFVRLSLWTRAGNQINEVWRVIALSESSDGKTFTPTLAKIGVKPVDFPRPADVGEVGRAIKDLYRRTERLSNRNPSRNGVRLRNARINDDGSIQRRNSDGSYAPPSSGALGYVWRGVVKSLSDTAAIVTMTATGDEMCALWTREDEVVAVGDIVLVSKDGDTGAYVLIQVIEAHKDALKRAQFLLTDTTNASGFGSGALLQMTSGGALYVFRNDGVMKFVNSAQGTGLFRHMNVFAGHIYATWTNARNSGTDYVKVYRHVKGGTTWEEVVGTPATAVAVHAYEAFGEPEGPPVVVTVAKSSIVDNNTNVSLTVTVWRLDSNGFTWVGQSHGISTTDDPALNLYGTIRFTFLYNSRYVFFSLDAAGSTKYLSVTRIDVDLNTATLVQDRGTLLSYVGDTNPKALNDADAADRWLEEFRVSPDGRLSIAKFWNTPTPSLTVFSRGLLGAAMEPAVVLEGIHVDSPRVQRDGGTETFYVSASVSDGPAAGTMRSMLWHVNGSNSIAVRADRVDATGNNAEDALNLAYGAWPYQDASGRISAVLGDPESYKMTVNYFTPF